MSFSIAIHGGAGTLPRKEMSAEKERAYRDGLSHALQAGFALLQNGASAIDAVCAAVESLEEESLFNAGKGAVFTRNGTVELDASIMDGKTLRAGAAAAVTIVKRPIRLARTVMEVAHHVMLVGPGAEQFAQEQGLEMVPNEYFHTPERRSQLERVIKGEAGLSALTISHVGTVGAVARDAAGNLAAATSTGGMTGKRFGRVGDSPIIGAGTYADNRGCAVSATGYGEMFIRAAVAHDICARMRYGGRSLEQAVHEVIFGELTALGGDGGVVAVDPAGTICMEFNSEGMFRASRRCGEPPFVGIYR